MTDLQSKHATHPLPGDDAGQDKLALYMTAGCGFCWSVMAVIDRLGLDVEMRDVTWDRALRDELMRARGRLTVPVLRIQSPDGTELWMPESRDIVQYLLGTYGQQ